jgi:hypothetical protein
VAVEFICKNSSHTPESAATIISTAILIGEDEDGNMTSVSRAVTKTVVDGYISNEKNNSKRQRSRKQNKRVKRAFDFFSSQYQTKRRAELQTTGEPAVFAALTKEARCKWGSMTHEARAPFEALHLEDKLKHQKEHEEYIKEHPIPPKKPRNAYHLFTKEMKGDKEKLGGWKTIEEEEKKRFIGLAAEDVLRYEAETSQLEEWCATRGVDMTTYIEKYE